MIILAHGVGGRQDLPLSLTELVVGAGLTLSISFLALSARWRQSRLDSDGTAGRPAPALQRVVDAPAFRWTLRLVGLLAAVYFGVGLLFGPDTADNPSAGAVYVLLWVGLVVASLLFGPVWRAVNPLRTVHRLAVAAVRRDPQVGLRPIPPGMGYWPAAVGLFAFVWLELVAPQRATLPVLTAWLATYVLAMAAGSVVFGAGWFERGDPFEVYSTLIGRLAVIGRRADGVLVWRNPLDGMGSLPTSPGLVAVVVVLLGSTMFDSLSNAPFWLRFVQENGLPAVVTATVGLIVVIAAVAAAYLAATRRAGPGPLAHSIVPIAVGYLVAHYYSLLILEGQRTVVLASDPLGTGADWLGTADWPVRTGLITPAGVAMLQISVIIIGHLFGTVLAHDRALRVFGPERVVAGQIPLLMLMLTYTTAGLLLLYAS
ncbi:hypothetical protein [Actinoplanes xinjiangensis]|uniref:Fenitrothion hydrolase n=1 Tax=Actinoplanes xinjiangensis TaxID=512350 RepID=A0A316EM53_9ACTN|nr:hypothetical protein [Actinoplanes xinjiangensis]PWK31692.1 hypothetical protein BC793_13241 [Actinoplanes xinjiangensis]GIF43935.1 hypothetical protein Axi01nite_82460 [Actinoplanes xinjiangensis]